ncbi:MAG: peptide deformylase [Candidatus Omnitrophica bacterium]|nr:peptide deformylase [Candidatus Omnitrophota bacterium]
MAILKVHRVPDPILKTPTKPVKNITSEIHKLAHDMMETMYAAGGVGLAANQVGIGIQMFVANPDHDHRNQELILINPVIVTQKGTISMEEGCLSLPGISAIVKRSKDVHVRALDLDGKSHDYEGRDLLARIFQHEIDHLNGLLFIDRVNLLKRRRLLREYEKQRRQFSQMNFQSGTRDGV